MRQIVDEMVCADSGNQIQVLIVVEPGWKDCRVTKMVVKGQFEVLEYKAWGSRGRTQDALDTQGQNCIAQDERFGLRALRDERGIHEVVLSEDGVL